MDLQRIFDKFKPVRQSLNEVTYHSVCYQPAHVTKARLDHDFKVNEALDYRTKSLIPPAITTLTIMDREKNPIIIRNFSTSGATSLHSLLNQLVADILSHISASVPFYDNFAISITSKIVVKKFVVNEHPYIVPTIVMVCTIFNISGYEAAQYIIDIDTRKLSDNTFDL